MLHSLWSLLLVLACVGDRLRAVNAQEGCSDLCCYWLAEGQVQKFDVTSWNETETVQACCVNSTAIFSVSGLQLGLGFASWQLAAQHVHGHLLPT
jgi:hypothetical protein